jgi:hypothetical protein
MHRVFPYKPPGEIRRIAVVILIAALGTVALKYSRNQVTVAEDGPRSLKRALHQPMDQQQAEGWFTPTPRITEAPENSTILEMVKLFPSSPPLPRARARPVTTGFYFELVRAQGDGEEGDYVLVARQCIPKIDMPEPCYLPESRRRNFPLRRE